MIAKYSNDEENRYRLSVHLLSMLIISTYRVTYYFYTVSG